MTKITGPWQKAAYVLTVCICIFLTVFSLLTVLESALSIQFNIRFGTPGLNVSWMDDQAWPVVVSATPDYPAANAGIRPGDRITAIDGRIPDRDIRNSEYFFGEPRAGRPVRLTIQRDGREREVRLVMQGISWSNKLLILSFLLIPPLLLAAYVLVGAWSLFSRFYTSETMLIALVSFSFGCLMYSPIGIPLRETWITNHLYFLQIKQYLFLHMFAPSLWLLLFLYFPGQHLVLKRFKVPILAALFLVPIGLLLLPQGLFSTAAFVVFIIIGVGGGVWLLHQRVRRAGNTLLQRQLRLVSFAIRVGGLALIASWLVLLVFIVVRNYTMDVVWFTMPLFLVLQCGGLLIPFIFVNSFLGRNLLETESALKRRIRYIGATMVLMIVYITLTFLLGRWLVARFALRDPGLIILFTLGISLTYSPLNRRVQRWLESRIYPEKQRYRQAFKSFVRQMSAFVEMEQFLENLTRSMEEIMRIRPAIVLALAGKGGARLPLHPDTPDSVVNHLRRGNVFYWDELPSEEESGVNPAEKTWAQANHLSLSLPLISYGELVGVLNIGRKTNDEDYSGDDLEILREVSDQVALGLYNLQLQGEYLEKKRLDKELNLARKIQGQLLPQRIPETPGLQVFGRMRPCFEVAGDYFDVITLPDGRVVLALADVSGKGAGAAMLMANLQAGLRSALRFTASLPDIAYELNNLVNQNTSAAQFITCFIALYHPGERTLQYVNAGHNPPLLVRADRRVERFSATGLILGAMPDMPYPAETVQLHSGDMLAVYTDGVEESNNPAQEEFGSERLIAVLQQNLGEPPQAVVEAMFREVESFAAGTPYADDATVLIAAVVD